MNPRETDTTMLSDIGPQLHSISPLSRRMRRTARFLGHALADTMAFVAMVYVFHWYSGESLVQMPSGAGRLPAILFAICWGVWFVWQGFHLDKYTRRGPFWHELHDQIKGILVLGALSSITLVAIGFHPVWQALALSWLCMLFVLPFGRWLVRQVLTAVGLWFSPTLIFGTGNNATEAALALQSEPAMGFKVVGFVSVQLGDAHCSPPPPVDRLEGLPVLVWDGSSTHLQVAGQCHCVLALDAHEGPLRDDIIRALSQKRVSDVHVIPAMRGVPLFGMDVSHFFSHEVLMIHVRNNLANRLHAATKRLFDVVVSAALLLLLSPLLAYLAYLVAKDGGPSIFGHERVGQGGKPFACLKFRSMVVDAKERLAHLLATSAEARAEWEKDFKLKNDPRINAVGHFLRRTSLDELPQLWNVLIGQMSLVGPRPVVQAELSRYGADVSYYLQAKPGITGLWQVSGRNDVDYDTRVYLDAWYVKNWTLWNDIAILFKTVGVVFNRAGAY